MTAAFPGIIEIYLVEQTPSGIFVFPVEGEERIIRIDYCERPEGVASLPSAKYPLFGIRTKKIFYKLIDVPRNFDGSPMITFGAAK